MKPDSQTLSRSMFIWFGMMVVAIANGAFRESILKSHFDEPSSHRISTLLLIVLLTLFVTMIVRRKPFEPNVPPILIGVAWLLLTLVFEFGFGHFIAGQSWSRLLSEYNILEGRIWVLVPLYLLALPWVAQLLAAKMK